ncbi:hypothetical protein [Simkania negevensis]|uniref:Uncharacterized protein n=1 Tax=Simkania negevensis (strain ATCC VR-1471 / DSM 27360 / Z) TaxID=331113 RepID=F8L3I2_SIMNZ|nr:hypothetical protein [Simkania negevensis]CCB89841.1 unknown protein [Simkania negevensis Z]
MSNLQTQDTNFAAKSAVLTTGAVPASSTDAKNAGQAIGYGFLVAAKLALYKLEDSYTELQQLASEVTQQQYTLTQEISQFLGKMTLNSMNSEATQLQTQAVGQFIMGGAALGLAGFQMYKNYKMDSQMSSLSKENENLEEYKQQFSEDREKAPTPLSNRPSIDDTQEDTTVKTRIKELKQGNFQEKFDTKVDADAAKLSSDENAKVIRDNAQRKIDFNNQERNRISNDKNTFSSYIQAGNNVTNGFTQGTTNTINAEQKKEQAQYEAASKVSQSTLGMVNASESYKSMDGFQQDALNVLKTIEALEQANRYQPA